MHNHLLVMQPLQNPQLCSSTEQYDKDDRVSILSWILIPFVRRLWTDGWNLASSNIQYVEWFGYNSHLSRYGGKRGLYIRYRSM
jgi:hypothetical protein